ncbi:hypothetical protein DIPPA_24395 [Diplonema papillatum]|nr:hypothetical protein DIPPA_24395 [Diplonema papillatum]
MTEPIPAQNPYVKDGGGAAAPAEPQTVKPANPYAGGEAGSKAKEPATAGVVNPYGGQTGGAPSATVAAEQRKAMLGKLDGVLRKHNVTIAEAQDLMLLLEYDVVVICDDSGSMQASALPANMRATSPPLTRWDELKSTVGQIIDIATCLDDNGIDLHFLNRESVLGVGSTSDARFLQAFNRPPSGGTPLCTRMQKIVAETSGPKPVLLIVATDGVPNEGPQGFKELVLNVLNRRITQHVFKIQVMVCTPNDDDVEWLNDLDCALDGFDVTDDYFTEKAEVDKTRRYPQFRKSDYIMKALLGPVCPRFDRQDEGRRPGSPGHLNARRSGPQQAKKDECCTLL